MWHRSDWVVSLLITGLLAGNEIRAFDENIALYNARQREWDRKKRKEPVDLDWEALRAAHKEEWK